MRVKRVKTKYEGVYQRKFDDKRDPRDGKADMCYDITFKSGAKKIWKKISWKSEGCTAQFAR